jgi:hypothetical protein
VDGATALHCGALRLACACRLACSAASASCSRPSPACACARALPEGPILADLARLRAQQWRVGQGDAARARELLEEALRAKGVGPIELAAAEACQILGDREAAGRFIEPAYQRAWADGPPYAYFFELERARAVLAALGLPEPARPSFDPTHVLPLPDEAGIYAFLADLEAKQRPWWQIWRRRGR